MNMKRKFFAGVVAAAEDGLTDRQIRVIVSEPMLDRVKEIMVPEGVQLDNYRRNPIVLADHDQTKPIGNADPEVKNGRLEAVITFAPSGIAAKADEYCGLAKAGVLNTVSIGFQPLEAEPIKGGGTRITKWELLEISVVAVPALPGAVVIGRSLDAATGAQSVLKVGASRTLPVAAGKAFDLEAASRQILERAGFSEDVPDSNWARKGFLAFDSAQAEAAESYRIPFADCIDGRLTVTPQSLTKAAAALDAASFPDDVAAKGRAVIKHYEDRMSEAGVKTFKPRIKSLYDCSRLADLLMSLGYVHDNAAWEAEYEADDSNVPAMLGEALRAVADALLAMTAEEVAELLAAHGIAGEGVETESETETKAFSVQARKRIAEAKTKAARTLRMIKAGRAISKANASTMAEACKAIRSGHDAILALLDDAAEEGSDDDAAEGEEGEKSLPAIEAKAVEVSAAARARQVELLALAGD